MLFLSLDSTQPNCLRRENEFIWTVPNLDLSCYSSVALSSLLVNYVNFDARNHDRIQISTSLIDKNTMNPSGIIHVLPGKSSYFMEPSRNFEFWPLDSIRPRFVLFTFHHANANMVKNFSVTLAFAKSENAA